MTTPNTGGSDRLHVVLLRLLADRHNALTTAELRDLATEDLDCDGGVPLVNEVVYRALRTLLRRGTVRRHRSGGRHVQWSLTPSGRAAAHTEK
ncbi:hypothetical protein [Mycobacterium avium]|uniref:hypothetical protein n=1 Tax=Mycobacterium avium TaxID=1764 RepID=UPI000BAFCCCC|nr:hypothetical protein [Mycobacterium avium]PBA42241.1 hypothetical protein CKJ63_07280 [Mycobacterium avium]PBA86048.1 hypothetical protein CKJ72_00285 [Mycobacterium avium]